ncbi:STT3 domain-containing protein [Nitratiruptor sp. YY09-18]|uniref:STT3 domain-containing protein n=1 Tax=Nitratiruptor sp. YY09-18 TaxID=2724901 RepID=UPI001915B587|nr:STT3 domain-containing protein [Nitratiruptor sp. YY09-18]BCD67752.1 undecaprenyl-diphosphooligosaccharide---protein glycotransferase [Nitratiruptor sp. YY09-18]
MSIQKDKFYLIVAMIVATLFSIWFRQIYLDVMPQFMDITYHGKFYILNNNDGYYWAEGARDILAGHHEPNDLSPVNYAASKLTAIIAQITGANFDNLIFFLPGILGSLLTIPLILIGYELGNTFMGFLAALLAPITWSYYHRTMYGYYDTDMLVIVLPLMGIWGIVRALRTKDFRDFWIAPLFFTLGIWWHAGLLNIAIATFVLTVLYIAIFDHTKRNFIYLLLLLIPLFDIPSLYKIIFIFAANLGFWRYENIVKNHIIYAVLIGVLLYLLLGGFSWMKQLLHNVYFVRSSVTTEEHLHFYGVINTVREASHIGWDTVIHRISGSYIGFVLGLVGYILLLIRNPKLLVSLAMVGLGLYAHWGGLRFTIFAVPFFALGDAYVIVLVAQFLAKFIKNRTLSRSVYFGIGLLAIAALIYPNYIHAKRYLTPPVFSAHEIDILKKFKKIAQREDYVLTWWDYGYPIRYYADVKTLVDGGKHSGDVNFPVSFALTTPNQQASYNMSVLDVYFTEEFYKNNIQNKTYIEAMMEYYKIKNPKDFLEFIQNPIPLPQVKENIFYYLPLRMLDIFPTVAKFSKIDLATGREGEIFFYQSRRFFENGNFLVLGNGLKIDLKKGMLLLGAKKLPLARFATVVFDKEGNANPKIQTLYPTGYLNVLYLPQMQKIVILDNSLFESTYIQMFFFDNYESNLFEPVIIDPMVKIYKLKK